MTQALQAGQQLGRFKLQRVLGQGGQATVWLAHDQRLDRPVALKLLACAEGGIDIDEWLHEARAVSRLNHPNVVPVFEAEHHAGQPYLVFEYVQGQTLAEAMRQKGAMPAREAVQCLVEVLDALSAAHALGIVHRDLKPSNVLIGTDGRARVMDFGIAAREQGGGDGLIVGTPGYMSPEAARGEPPKPAMDVFAAGVVLAELLAGHRLLAERDPWEAIRRVQAEDLALPRETKVDDVLRALVQRAMARDPAQRPPGAAALRDALKLWLQPAAAQAAGGQGTLDFLLRRMRHKTDFPALSASVMRIQRLAASDSESLHSLAEEVLKDVALSHKLLRMVNTAHFQRAGAGSIQTITRAVALVGFAGIRNMALSLVLLEHMHNKEHAAHLVEEFLRALMAGTLASDLADTAREREEIFIGAMFQNLGRLLTEYYFPEEAEQIRQRLREPGQPWPGTVAAEVLGMSFEELGAGVARSWGLPESLQRCMRTPEGEPPQKPVNGVDRARWLSRAANDLTDIMLRCEPADAPRQLASMADAHAKALNLQVKRMIEATRSARGQLADMVAAMGLAVPAGSPARRLLAAPAETPATPASEAMADAATAVLAPAAQHPPDAQTVREQRAAGTNAVAHVQVSSDRLTRGIQDITQRMVSDDFKLNDVLQQVLSTLHEALACRRVVLCLRDGEHSLQGRFGVGEGGAELAKVFKVPIKLAPGQAPDLFAALCLKGVDSVIEDSQTGALATRLPPWYAKQVGRSAFVVLPLLNSKAAFGLIYADRPYAQAMALSEQELGLLRTLRNQVVMAFKQAA